jgi:hypothetical protein
MAGMVRAACAWSVISGAPGAASAGLVPGSMSSTRTSCGVEPSSAWTMTSMPRAGPVHTGAVPPRTPPEERRAPPFCSTSSCSTVDHSPQVPVALFVRSCTVTAVTESSRAQVMPTVENGSFSGRETVRAGTPLSSSPELATSSELEGLTGVPGCPAAGGATSASGPASTMAPSAVTTAASSGCSTEPSSTAAIDGAIGSASGTGAA